MSELLLLALLSFAHAAPSPARTVRQVPIQGSEPTVTTMVQDLRGSDKADRRLAAATLRSEVRVAARRADAAPPGSMREAEALVALEDLRLAVGPACIDGLGVPDIRRECADMLGMLQEEAALDRLKLLEQGLERRGERRAVSRAIARIEESRP